MSDSDSDADTEDYEPSETRWRWLEADEFMEAEFMEDEFMKDEADEFMDDEARRIAPQASPFTTVMADKDSIRDQRMIMVFSLVISLCAIVLGLQSTFTCTCNLNF
jgi:hypothetical protein